MKKFSFFLIVILVVSIPYHTFGNEIGDQTFNQEEIVRLLLEEHDLKGIYDYVYNQILAGQDVDDKISLQIKQILVENKKLQSIFIEDLYKAKDSGIQEEVTNSLGTITRYNNGIFMVKGESYSINYLNDANQSNFNPANVTYSHNYTVTIWGALPAAKYELITEWEEIQFEKLKIVDTSSKTTTYLPSFGGTSEDEIVIEEGFTVRSKGKFGFSDPAGSREDILYTEIKPGLMTPWDITDWML